MQRRMQRIVEFRLYPGNDFAVLLVEYVAHNGLLKDMAVLQGYPFADHSSIVDIFPDVTVWQGICAVIRRIKANAMAS